MTEPARQAAFRWDDEVSELAPRLRLAIARTARRLRQESRSAGLELTPTLLAALATIEREGPLTPSDLALREGISRPTVARLLAKLDELGMIKRLPDPEDGRSSLISTTEAASERIEAIRSRKDAFLAHQMATLTPEQIELLAGATEILERMLSADGTGLADKEPG